MDKWALRVDTSRQYWTTLNSDNHAAFLKSFGAIRRSRQQALRRLKHARNGTTRKWILANNTKWKAMVWFCELIACGRQKPITICPDRKQSRWWRLRPIEDRLNHLGCAINSRNQRSNFISSFFSPGLPNSQKHFEYWLLGNRLKHRIQNESDAAVRLTNVHLRRPFSQTRNSVQFYTKLQKYI